MGKRTLFAIILSFGLLLSGCETTKGVVGGVATGVATGLGTTVSGTADGVAKDTHNLWQAVLETDRWIKENLW